MKVLYGIRYDLFDVPSARTFAPNPYSQDFTIDKNNFAPRVGFSWSLDERATTVLRASMGMMYEPPLIDFYDNAILSNGDPRAYTVTVAGTAAGAPPYPTSLANVPAGFVLPRQSITAVDPDFATQYAWLTNVQVERALRSDMSLAVGYVNSVGRNLPVLMDVNLIPTGQALADGRPVYSTTVSSATRVDPTFDHVNVFQSIGESTYNAFTATFSKRMTHGWQAQATYTFAHGEDNAPSDRHLRRRQRRRSRVRSVEPRSRSGRHAVPPDAHVRGIERHRAVVHRRRTDDGAPQQQPVRASSCRPTAACRSTSARTRTSTATARPPIARSASTATRVASAASSTSTCATRASFRWPSAQRIELFFEAKNLFNTENVAGVNRVVTTDAAGNPSAPLPDPFPPTSGYDQRQMQLGVKFVF